MAAILGFDGAALVRLNAGEIVSTELTESSSRELALAVAAIVPASHREIYSRIRDGEWFAIDRTVVAVGELGPGRLTGKAFAGLPLETPEAERLAGVEPGHGFNLSVKEIQRINAAVQTTPGDRASAALAAYREVLAARVNTYRAAGIDGIGTYVRRRGTAVSPARDARRAAEALGGMDARCAEFYHAFTHFPERGSRDVEHRFFWAVLRIQDRPTVVLSHWVMQLHHDYALVAERQYYVGQAYNTLQIIAGAFRLDDRRSVVFYTNRTATEQVSGFGGALARMLGRNLMRDEIVELFVALRHSLAHEAPPTSR